MPKNKLYFCFHEWEFESLSFSIQIPMELKVSIVLCADSVRPYQEATDSHRDLSWLPATKEMGFKLFLSADLDVAVLVSLFTVGSLSFLEFMAATVETVFSRCLRVEKDVTELVLESVLFTQGVVLLLALSPLRDGSCSP
eukprot:IDg23147t1